MRGSGHDNIGWKNVMLNVLRAVSLAIQGTYSNTTCCSHATSASSSRPSETVIYIKVMQFVSYVLGNLNILHKQFDKTGADPGFCEGGFEGGVRRFPERYF